jgi:hypothetical protein
MSDSFYKSEMDREMLLNIEIQKQNLKSLPEKFKPQKKTVSPVTQQMIDDYKQQFRDSYKRSKDGTAQFYKFLIPEALPTLESLDKGKLLREGKLLLILDDDEIKEVNNQINIYLDLYNRNENINIPELLKEIKEYKEDINKTSIDRLELLEFKKSLVSLDDINKYEPLIKEDLLNFDNEINEYNNLIKDTNDNINELANDNKKYLDNIRLLKNQLEENDENKIKNEKALYTIEQDNKKKLADYAETLRIMNEGQISIEQAPGESETDFLKRLADVALIEEDLTRARLFNTNEFKKNLKTIIKSEWKIENLVKSFNNDSQFLLNKTFAGFKKYFIKVYGAGNQNLEVEEYISLINGYLDSTDLSKIKKEKKEREEETKGEIYDEIDEIDKIDEIQPPPPPFPRPPPTAREFFGIPDEENNNEIPQTSIFATPVTDLPEVEATALPPPPKSIRELTLQDVKISKEDDFLRFENTANNKNIYFKLIEPTEKRGIVTANKIIKYSLNNIDYEDVGKGSAFSGKFITRLKLIDPSNNDLNVIINMISSGYGLTVTRFIDFFDSIKSGEGLRKSTRFKKSTRGKSEKLKKTKKKPVVQKGASIKTVPTHCQFGKTIILLNKLYQNNILSVKDSNNINIQGIPNSKVDDKFVNIILGICNDEEVNKKDIDTLSEKDFILINVLMKKAGLTKKYNIDNTKAIKLLKDRLELVEGQILAGNTNEEIKKELYDIVFKLANLGATSLSNSRKYYKDVVKLMF